MIKWILGLFGVKKEEINFNQLVKNGALIVDVRSPEEFQSGHIKKSKNIPLNELNVAYKALSKKQGNYNMLCLRNAQWFCC